jgi:hypothetical protein
MYQRYQRYQRYQPTEDSYDLRRFPIYVGTPKSSISAWDFPWKQPTAKHFWGIPMTMEPPPLWKTAWDQPNDLVGSIGSSRFNAPMAWDRLRRGKAHGFHRHHRHNPDLMFFLPWAYRGKFLRFPCHRQIARRIEKLCGFRRLFARVVGYVWGIKPG